MLVFEYTGLENSPSYYLKFKPKYRYWRQVLENNTFNELFYVTEKESKHDLDFFGKSFVNIHVGTKLTRIESKFIAVVYGYNSNFTPEVTIHFITSENDAIISTDDETQWFLLQCKYPDIMRFY